MSTAPHRQTPSAVKPASETRERAKKTLPTALTGATGNLVVIYVALDMTATYAVARHRSDKAKQTIKREGR